MSMLSNLYMISALNRFFDAPLKISDKTTATSKAKKLSKKEIIKRKKRNKSQKQSRKNNR